MDYLEAGLRTTVYTNSFQGKQIPIDSDTLYFKRTCSSRRPYQALPFMNTLGKFKRYLPSSLYEKPKDIIGTKPSEKLITTIKSSINSEHEMEIRKTRPRIVFQAAISMDDIEEVRRRPVINNICYASTVKTSYGRVVPKPAPVKDHFTKVRPLRLQGCQYPVVPPEWRMETVTWQDRQEVGYVDPTEVFWLRGKKDSCKKYIC